MTRIPHITTVMATRVPITIRPTTLTATIPGFLWELVLPVTIIVTAAGEVTADDNWLPARAVFPKRDRYIPISMLSLLPAAESTHFTNDTKLTSVGLFALALNMFFKL